MNIIPFPVQTIIAPVAAEDAKPKERPMPRYCDPDNEVIGEKYDPKLNSVDIAKILRGEVKERIKAGKLPKMKVSIRSPHYGSVCIKVSELDIPVYNPLFIAAAAVGADTWNTPWRGEYTEEASALLKELEGMAKAYRRDNSDAQSDYFDCSLYVTTGVEWQWERAERERLVSAEREHPTFELTVEHGQVRSFRKLDGSAE